MKFRLYIVLFLMSSWNLSFSQDTLSKTHKKFEVSITLGAGLKGFYSGTHIESTEEIYADSFEEHKYDNFTKAPTFGMEAGILLSYHAGKRWSLQTGVTYRLRKTIYNKSQVEVIADPGYPASLHNIHNVYKYNYSYNNLEFPFMLGYSIRKFSIFAGAQFSLIGLCHANYHYMMNTSVNQDESWYTSEKKINQYQTTLCLYPTVRMSYTLEFSGFECRPYLGVEFFEINMKEFYLYIERRPFYIESTGPTVENCFSVMAGVTIPLSFE